MANKPNILDLVGLLTDKEAEEIKNYRNRLDNTIRKRLNKVAVILKLV